jgi:hypothetical protein
MQERQAKSRIWTRGVTLGLIAMTAAGGAFAASPAGMKMAAVVQAVIDCHAVPDNAQRLACYDDAVGKFIDAKTKGDVVVMDREQVSKARRSVFGLDLPDLSFDRGALNEPDTMTSTITEVKRVGGAMWLMTIEGGAKWVQVSGRFQTPPHVGSKVVIRRAGVGSYMMSVDGGREVRVGRKN